MKSDFSDGFTMVSPWFHPSSVSPSHVWRGHRCAPGAFPWHQPWWSARVPLQWGPPSGHCRVPAAGLEEQFHPRWGGFKEEKSGIDMDFYGLIWISMDWYGFLWIDMDFYGLIWISMDWYGFLWIDMDFYGLIWISMDWYGFLWIDMDFCGLIWISMDWYGFLWIDMDFYGLIWISMDWYGFLWISRGFLFDTGIYWRYILDLWWLRWFMSRWHKWEFIWIDKDVNRK